MPDDILEPPKFESIDDAVEWLEPFMTDNEDIQWQRCYAMRYVYELYGGEKVIQRIRDRYKLARRTVYYLLKAARDWAPEKRFRDHSFGWHWAVSLAASECGDPLEKVAEASLGHGVRFIEAVRDMTQRRRTRLRDAGANVLRLNDEVTYMAVAEEMADADVRDIIVAEAQVCPVCGGLLQRWKWARVTALAQRLADLTGTDAATIEAALRAPREETDGHIIVNR